MRSTKAIIDLSALKNNFQKLKAMTAPSKVMAIVKANAYGHGFVEVAKALQNTQQGVEKFAVATIGEAIALRKAGIKAPILLLEGFFDGDELKAIQEYQFETVIHSIQQIEWLEHYAQKKSLFEPIQIWLKLDTRMFRLGFPPAQVGALVERIQAIKVVKTPVNLMSHFSSADSDREFSSEQLSIFENATQFYKTERSMANSAGIITQKNAHYDWVRPGLLLYGASPMANKAAQDFGLTPVMSLESQIMAVKPIKKGESVGYGRNWFAEDDTYIGLVAIGYGDGYPRHAKNGTPIWINGREVPLVGRVSMDMLAVDLGSDSKDKIGDRVVLWGKELPMGKVAPYMDTIPYTLCCGVTSRVQFEYVND